jgi:hypothetical protein
MTRTKEFEDEASNDVTSTQRVTSATRSIGSCESNNINVSWERQGRRQGPLRRQAQLENHENGRLEVLSSDTHLSDTSQFVLEYLLFVQRDGWYTPAMVSKLVGWSTISSHVSRSAREDHLPSNQHHC